MSTYEKKYGYTFMAILFLIAALGYMDRFIVNYAIVAITQDLQLNAANTGLILSSFYAGYALMQIPGGWLADRFGTNKVFLTIVFIWSAFTFMTGMVGTLMAMVAVRFVFGLAEGPFYATSVKAVSEVYPRQQQSRVFSIITSSGAIIGLITPVFATWMMTNYGWRSQFFVVGLAGGVALLAYWIFLKSFKKSKEFQLNETIDKKPAKVPFKSLLKSQMIWKLLIAYYAVYTISWGLGAWMPSYQVKQLHIDLMSIGFLSMIPALSSILGFYVSGYVLDKVSMSKAKIIASLCAFGSAIFIYLMSTTAIVSVFYTYYTIQSFMLPFLLIYFPSIIMKNFPTQVAGSATGLTGIGAQIAGFVTPLAMGISVDMLNGSFRGAFWLMVVAGSIAGLTVLTFSENKKHYVSAPTTDFHRVQGTAG